MVGLRVQGSPPPQLANQHARWFNALCCLLFSYLSSEREKLTVGGFCGRVNTTTTTAAAAWYGTRPQQKSQALSKSAEERQSGHDSHEEARISEPSSPLGPPAPDRIRPDTRSRTAAAAHSQKSQNTHSRDISDQVAVSQSKGIRQGRKESVAELQPFPSALSALIDGLVEHLDGNDSG
ncbi:hypothetical protein B7463_g12728, partial [Scytalidium lignicola]